MNDRPSLRLPSHAPALYECPFCAIASGRREQERFVGFRDDAVIVIISLRKYPSNAGHALVAPVQHYENIYDLPDQLLDRVNRVAKRVAVAMRQTFGCAGVTLRQNNEPAGNQDVWHYHLHVVPRHPGDSYGAARTQKAGDGERERYASLLREYLAANPS